MTTVSMRTSPRAQRGIALLIALLTVALAAVIIASLLDRGELALARTRNAIRGEQAEAYAQGLEAYAAEILLKDLTDNPGIDSNSDIWAGGLPPQIVPGGTIVASMHDLNGCFNLNDLADAANAPNWLGVFVQLLVVRGVDASTASAIATAAQAWIGGAGANSDTTDAYYLAQPVPYRSAQRMFAHVSELRLVRGVTGDIYARVAPYVCALPPGTTINVNTASVPVLQALGQNMTQAQAQSLWQNGDAQWPDVTTFTRQAQAQGATIPVQNQALLGVTSDHFLARGDVVLDGVPFTFYSLIERDNGNLGIRVIERSRGSDEALAESGTPAETASAAAP